MGFQYMDFFVSDPECMAIFPSTRVVSMISSSSIWLDIWIRFLWPGYSDHPLLPLKGRSAFGVTLKITLAAELNFPVVLIKIIHKYFILLPAFSPNRWTIGSITSTLNQKANGFLWLNFFQFPVFLQRYNRRDPPRRKAGIITAAILRLSDRWPALAYHRGITSGELDSPIFDCMFWKSFLSQILMRLAGWLHNFRVPI